MINNEKIIPHSAFQIGCFKKNQFHFRKIYIFSKYLTEKAGAAHYKPVFVSAAAFYAVKPSSRSSPCHSVTCCWKKSLGCVNVFMNAWFGESVYLALSSCCLITGNPSCECVCVYLSGCVKLRLAGALRRNLAPVRPVRRGQRPKSLQPCFLFLSLPLSLSVFLSSTGIWK